MQTIFAGDDNMDKKNEIPVPDPFSKEYEYFFPSASWNEMTGLIPVSTDDESEINSYNNIFPYLPDDEIKN